MTWNPDLEPSGVGVSQMRATLHRSLDPSAVESCEFVGHRGITIGNGHVCVFVM
jgi:hypothetical protein